MKHKILTHQTAKHFFEYCGSVYLFVYNIHVYHHLTILLYTYNCINTVCCYNLIMKGFILSQSSVFIRQTTRMTLIVHVYITYYRNVATGRIVILVFRIWPLGYQLWSLQYTIYLCVYSILHCIFSTNYIITLLTISIFNYFFYRWDCDFRRFSVSFF